MAQKFAVFDIDGTLIRWQLYHAVVSRLASAGHLSKEAQQAIKEARLTWKKRSNDHSYSDYETTLMESYMEAIRDISVKDYEQAIDAAFQAHKDQVYIFTRDLVRKLKEEGYLLFAISASQQEIVAKLAEYYGFDDHIGAVFETKNGRFTGEVESPWGRKGDLLQKLAAKHKLSFAGSIGVGDSGSDVAMLELVETAIAFNPEMKLLAAAKEHGWDVVVERKNVIYKLEPHDGSFILA